MRHERIASALEALDTAAEAYAELREELEAYAEELDELGRESVGAFDASESVGVVEGAVLDFREAIGDPDPSQAAAVVGRVFLDEARERGFKRGADGSEENRSALSDGLARDGFRALVRRFLP